MSIYVLPYLHLFVLFLYILCPHIPCNPDRSHTIPLVCNIYSCCFLLFYLYNNIRVAQSQPEMYIILTFLFSFRSTLHALHIVLPSCIDTLYTFHVSVQAFLLFQVCVYNIALSPTLLCMVQFLYS